MQSLNNHESRSKHGPRFLRFLKASWFEIFLDIILSVVLYFILSSVDMSSELIAFLIICVLVIGLIRISVRYSSDKRFWTDVDNLIEAGIDVSDIGVLIHEPLSYQGRITYGAIDTLIGQYSQSIQSAQTQIVEQKEFIETWIHEVKTPLAASYLIADHYPGSSAIELKRQLSRIESYTEQALYYARMQSLDRDYIVRPALVSHIVKEAIKSRSLFLIENDIHIKTDNLEHEVLCDEKWMIFIIGQLIDNAIKYRDPNKSTSYLEFKLEASTDGIEDIYTLSIVDNGIGISQADIKRIFDKGFTGSNGRQIAKEKATGIGLYLVEKLAHKMDVDVSVSSSVGEYTKVDLLFAQLSDDND